MSIAWHEVLTRMPLIAILRGVRPEEAGDVVAALHAAGFLCAEIPLNSPDAPRSIAELRARFAGRMLIGAGTVLSTADVAVVRRAGAQFVVSPNTDLAVIKATKDAGLPSLPGFATPSEAFAALGAGADALKLFPAEAHSPAGLRALRAVLPPALPILPVGGISGENMAAWLVGGADGFGIGSSLYAPDRMPADVQQRATQLVDAFSRYPRDSRVFTM